MKQIWLSLTFLLLSLLAKVNTTAFDDYMNRDEPEYKWEHTGKTFSTLMGGKAHVLNVTSLRWLTDDDYTVVGSSSLWSHEVVVIVPRQLEFKNIATIYMASLHDGCNNEKPIENTFNFDLEMGDIIAADTRAVTIVSFQTPNCPMIFKDDPSQMQRHENSQIAWSLHQFFFREDHDPQRIIIMAMAKAAMQQMKAAEEFIHEQNFATLEDGWNVIGVSKRGWTTYLVGAARCQQCVKIASIMPLCPIVPSLVPELHHQYQAYGGFSFAFQEFMDADIIDKIDTDVATNLLPVVDPLTYADRLKDLPTSIVLASNDEFMMFEWSDLWFDKFKGETHLTILPNAEHVLATNLPGALSTVTSFIKSIASGRKRPDFSYTHNNQTGEISVTIPEEYRDQLEGVYLRHSETISNVRRDFRFVRQENNNTEPCSFPEFTLPFGIEVQGGNCAQPVLWWSRQLSESEPGTYKASPPEPSHSGHWVGYYLEVYFKADTSLTTWFLHNRFGWTTPGYVWPDTLPFPDCHGDCKQIPV